MPRRDVINLLRDAIKKTNLEDCELATIEVTKYLKARYDPASTSGHESKSNFKEPRHKEIEEARKAKKSKTSIKYKPKPAKENQKSLIQRLIEFRNKTVNNESIIKQQEEEEGDKQQLQQPQQQQPDESKIFSYHNIARTVLPISRRKPSSLDAIQTLKIGAGKKEKVIERPNTVACPPQAPKEDLQEKSGTMGDKIRSTPFRGPWPKLRLSSPEAINRMKPSEYTDLPMNRLILKPAISKSKLKSLGERTLLAIKERKERNDRLIALEKMTERQAKIAELRARAETAMNRYKHPCYHND